MFSYPVLLLMVPRSRNGKRKSFSAEWVQGIRDAVRCARLQWPGSLHYGTVSLTALALKSATAGETRVAALVEKAKV
jgi:hypothetical protein